MSRIFPACAAALALFYLFVMIPGLAVETGPGSHVQAMGLGPSAVPYFAGVMVLLLSLVMLVQGWAERGGAATVAWRPLGLFVVLLVGFAAAITVVGFLAAAIGFLGATFIVFRAGSPVTAAIVAIAVPVAIDQLMRNVFLIPLPTFPGL